MSRLAHKELFGGAIIATMPDNLVDVSALRQVPDTQEVFLYPNSNVSIIVEILQSVEPQNLIDAARYHFDSLAHDNDAEDSVVQDIQVIPNDRGDDTPSPVVAYGVQHVNKYNRQIADKVWIFMSLYRVESKSVDLLVHMNVPIQTGDDGAVGEAGVNAAKADFDVFSRSLHISDFSLFV